jgi:hypothetical protein
VNIRLIQLAPVRVESNGFLGVACPARIVGAIPAGTALAGIAAVVLPGTLLMVVGGPSRGSGSQTAR